MEVLTCAAAMGRKAHRLNPLMAFSLGSHACGSPCGEVSMQGSIVKGQEMERLLQTLAHGCMSV